MLSPTYTTDRKTITRDRRTNDGQSSRPEGGAARPASPGPARARMTVSDSSAPATAGITRYGDAPSPPAASSGVTRIGAEANPRVPPSENQLIRT